MRKVLCLLVAFVLSSSVAFSQDASNTNNSTVSTKSFFDTLISKKAVSVEYRHYLNSKVNENVKFSGFSGMPQFRVLGLANLFDGVLVGGIYVQTSFISETPLQGNEKVVFPETAGLVDVVEFSLTSPYTSFNSDYLDTTVTLSWTPALLNKYGIQYESINGKVETTLKAPSFNLGNVSLNLSSGVEYIVHFVPFNRDANKGVAAQYRGVKPAFALTGATSTKSQQPDMDLTVTVLSADIPVKCVKGLTFNVKSEYESNYFTKVGTNNDGSKKTYYSVDRETRTSVGVGYALTSNLSISNTVVYNMDGFYKDSRNAKKWTDLIALKYSL